MPEENEKTPDSTEGESKPTITIAEKEGAASATAAEKPTITIAEKEKGGE